MKAFLQCLFRLPYNYSFSPWHCIYSSWYLSSFYSQFPSLSSRLGITSYRLLFLPISSDLYRLTMIIESPQPTQSVILFLSFFLEPLEEVLLLKCHQCFKLKYLWLYSLFLEKIWPQYLLCHVDGGLKGKFTSTLWRFAGINWQRLNRREGLQIYYCAKGEDL